MSGSRRIRDRAEITKRPRTVLQSTIRLTGFCSGITGRTYRIQASTRHQVIPSVRMYRTISSANNEGKICGGCGRIRRCCVRPHNDLFGYIPSPLKGSSKWSYPEGSRGIRPASVLSACTPESVSRISPTTTAWPAFSKIISWYGRMYS